MLNLLLKHIVAEVAINVLFDTLFDNFIKPHITSYISNRKLSSNWTLELQSEIQALHGINIHEEMLKVLQFEITNEIDRDSGCVTYPIRWG